MVTKVSQNWNSKRVVDVINIIQKGVNLFVAPNEPEPFVFHRSYALTYYNL